jgi:hypothetical protein
MTTVLLFLTFLALVAVAVMLWIIQGTIQDARRDWAEVENRLESHITREFAALRDDLVASGGCLDERVVKINRQVREQRQTAKKGMQ